MDLEPNQYDEPAEYERELYEEWLYQRCPERLEKARRKAETLPLLMELRAAKIAGELPAKIQMIDIARMTPEELETAHAEFITNKPDWTEFQI